MLNVIIIMIRISLIKQIILTWIKLFLYIIAVSYLVSLEYKEFEPQYIYTYVVGTLVMAVAIELLREKKGRKGN